MKKMILLGYFVSIIALMYFGINGIVLSAMSDTFPNPKFLIILILILTTTLTIGIGIQKYLSLQNEADVEKSKKQFILTSAIGLFVILILFSFN